MIKVIVTVWMLFTSQLFSYKFSRSVVIASAAPDSTDVLLNFSNTNSSKKYNLLLIRNTLSRLTTDCKSPPKPRFLTSLCLFHAFHMKPERSNNPHKESTAEASYRTTTNPVPYQTQSTRLKGTCSTTMKPKFFVDHGQALLAKFFRDSCRVSQ